MFVWGCKIKHKLLSSIGFHHRRRHLNTVWGKRSYIYSTALHHYRKPLIRTIKITRKFLRVFFFVVVNCDKQKTERRWFEIIELKDILQKAVATYLNVVVALNVERYNHCWTALISLIKKLSFVLMKGKILNVYLTVWFYLMCKHDR